MFWIQAKLFTDALNKIWSEIRAPMEGHCRLPVSMQYQVMTAIATSFDHLCSRPAEFTDEFLALHLALTQKQLHRLGEMV